MVVSTESNRAKVSQDEQSNKPCLLFNAQLFDRSEWGDPHARGKKHALPLLPLEAYPEFKVGVRAVVQNEPWEWPHPMQTSIHSLSLRNIC